MQDVGKFPKGKNVPNSDKTTILETTLASVLWVPVSAISQIWGTSISGTASLLWISGMIPSTTRLRVQRVS